MVIQETTAPPERGRKIGPSTPLDQWILTTMRTDPGRGYTSRWLAARLDKVSHRWTASKISGRMAVLAQRGVLVRDPEPLPGREGYLYHLAD